VTFVTKGLTVAPCGADTFARRSFGEGLMSTRKQVAQVFGVTAVATLLYYAFIAPAVLAALSLAVPMPSAASVQVVAISWAVAEAVAVALPFLALALVAWTWPSLLPRYIWLIPVAVVIVPVLTSSLFNLWATGSFRSDLGIGGGLVSEFALAVDVLAVLLGSALVILAQGRTARPDYAHAKAAGTQR
jgi:hypothetical protein